MIKDNSLNAVCFDDILLVPQSSQVQSRHEVDISMMIGMENPIILATPVIAAPMDTVCDVEMCIAMSDLGGMGILHRYMPYDKQLIKAKNLVGLGATFGVAIASNNGFMEHARALVEEGVDCLLVDTANGHGEYAIDAVRSLRKEFPYDVHIMAGNVATGKGYVELAKAGADSVRVGIGGGSACTTRLVSGHGVPTLSSIIDADKWREELELYNCSIIADGGIRNSGDMVKSFAAGADAVMVGSLLAGTDEAPGEILTDSNGKQVKSFRGMASASAQKEATGRVSVSEGISTTVPYKGSVSHILEQIRGGLGSGCSYSGIDRLGELSLIAQYIQVSPLSLAESVPHAL